MAEGLHIYDLNLEENADLSKMSASKLFVHDDTMQYEYNIWVMCDTTFAQHDYDIGLTDKYYREIGAIMLPYHYIICSVEKNAKNIKANGITRADQTWGPGSVFRGRPEKYVNGVAAGGTEIDAEGKRLMCSEDDICIVLTLPHGSWLTRGVNTEVSKSLKLLILYLCNTWRMDASKQVFNWKWDGEPDPSINQESWKEFLDSIIEAQASDPNTFAFASDDGSEGYIVPDNMFPTLENVARKFCSQNASDEDIKDMMKFIIDNNPTIKTAYYNEIIDLDKMRNYPIPGGSHIKVPHGSPKSAEIKANLANKNILSNYDSNKAAASETTIIGDGHGNKISTDWNDPATVHRPSDDQIFLTNRGGKSEMKWRYGQMELPGYHNGMLAFQKRNSSEAPIYINFVISPSSFSSNYSNNVSDTKTLGGWVGIRAGKNPINVRFSGYMLDIYDQLERHRFLANYKEYIEDQKDSSHSYYNAYNCKLIIEGRDYYGYVAGISFSKEAEKPFLYQYNISFVAYNDKEIYDKNWALVPAYKTERNKGGNEWGHHDNIDSTDGLTLTLKTLLEEGWAGDKSKSSRKMLDQLLADAELSDEYMPLVTYWVKVLQHIKESNDFGKEFLIKLRDANIVTNLDVWCYEDADPDMQSTIALIDKLCSYSSSDRNPVDSGHPTNTSNGCWSQPNALSLYAKGILKDKSSWFKDDWTMRDGYSKECMSRATFLAICDNLGGAEDECLYKNYTDEQVREKLKTYAKGYENFPEKVHWCEKNIISLVDKGAIATPVDSYWFEDPEKTINPNYAMALLCKAFAKTSWSEPVSMSIIDYDEAKWDITKAAAVKLIATKFTRAKKFDVRSDEYAHRNANIRWDQPFLCDLYQRAMINDWPVKSEGDNIGTVANTWATYELREL